MTEKNSTRKQLRESVKYTHTRRGTVHTTNSKPLFVPDHFSWPENTMCIHPSGIVWWTPIGSFPSFQSTKSRSVYTLPEGSLDTPWDRPIHCHGLRWFPSRNDEKYAAHYSSIKNGSEQLSILTNPNIGLLVVIHFTVCYRDIAILSKSLSRSTRKRWTLEHAIWTMPQPSYRLWLYTSRQGHIRTSETGEITTAWRRYNSSYIEEASRGLDTLHTICIHKLQCLGSLTSLDYITSLWSPQLQKKKKRPLMKGGRVTPHAHDRNVGIYWGAQRLPSSGFFYRHTTPGIQTQ